MDTATFTRREITPGAQIAPPPGWVEVAPYTIPQAANPHFIAGGLCVLLDDSQIDLCGHERAWYYRRADLVTADAGAQHAAQFSVSFDPTFERVEVHSIAVIRHGQRIEHTPTINFEVMRRERNMELAHLDGRMTVHATLPDVRQGDVVETSYTAYGMRKSLDGRHSAFIALEWPVGIVEVRLRQRAPNHKHIAERSYNDAPMATQTEANGIVERRWHIVERPGRRYEALTPPWTLQGAALQFSEWRDWAEVAAAFTPLYEDEGPLPAEVEQEIQRIGASEKTAAGRAAAILRFTQSAVRYLAISIGEGGFTPRSLDEICSKRYGDCKDKSKLFVHMARRLGLDACPALVNTRDGYALPDWLPSGQLFDHCIVRVAVDGKVYWIDPTRQLQPSPLDKVSQCHFGWALPLRTGTTAPEQMAEPAVEHMIETHENIVLGDSPEANVRYEWKHIFRGVTAEGIREQFTRDGAISVFKNYAEDLQRTWPRASVVNQEIVADSIASNEITIREVYDIGDAWTHVSGETYKFATRALTPAGSLAPLDGGDRQYAIFLGQPGKRTRRVELRTAKAHEGSWSRSHRGSTLRYSDEMRIVNPKLLVVEQEFVISAMTLPASEAETYRKVHADMGRNELVLTETAVGGKFLGARQPAQETSFWDVLRWLWIGLLVIYLLSRFAG